MKTFTIIFGLLLQFTLNAQPTNPTIAAVVNGASYANGPVAPGEIVTLFGSGMGPSTLVTLVLDSQGKVASNLSGVQVLFDGTPAPLLYVSAMQVSAVTPFGLSGKASTQVQVIYNGVSSTPFQKLVSDSAPGIFSIAGTGAGVAAMTNADGLLNSSSNPAALGSPVTFYVTGVGRINPAAVDGTVATGIARSVLPVAATIGGRTAQVLYAGAAPGIVNGFTQVNVVVPTDLTTGGLLPLEIRVGDVTSQQGITIAVKSPASRPATIFLIHGLGQGASGIQAFAGGLTAAFGPNSSSFRVDGGFDFSECSANTSCAANCTISNGAEKLAQHILRVKPPGDVILIGYSMGGLLARDVIANNRLATLNGRVTKLLTLGSPMLGYPYSTFDRFLYCSTLIQQMDGNWRQQQQSNTPVLSSYLSAIQNQWNVGSFPGSGDVWFSASGRSCANPLRSLNSSGCRDRSPFSDGVVCDDSASYFGSAANKPTELWQDPGQIYVHTNSAGGAIGSGLILCSNDGRSPSLGNPPAFGPLFDAIRNVLLASPVRQSIVMPEAIRVLSLPEDKQRQFVILAMDAGFPERFADGMTLLLLNRPSLVVPLLEARLVSMLGAASKDERWIMTATEMIAYSGSSQAIQAINRLLTKDENRWSYLVTRLLDNDLANGGDSIQLVNEALANNNATLKHYVTQWRAARK